MKTHNAILLTPEVVRGVVVKDSPGVYLLGNCSPETNTFEITYIGRSDKCLQKRLGSHNHTENCEYFVHLPCPDATEAFFLECYLWHALKSSPIMLNRIHPSSPEGTGMECPFCSTAKHFFQFVREREAKAKR